MSLETERLLLRPWQETDAESLYKYAKDPDVGPAAGWQPHASVENSLGIIKSVLSAEETYAVCLKEDNVAIGSIGLISPAQTHTKAEETEMEIGYWIGVPFWGNGYIPEAVRAIQRHAFEDLGCTALWCGYYDGNEKSKRCQEKCGFVYHHTEENKLCELMCDIRTEHFTRLKKEEWKNMIKEKTIDKAKKLFNEQHYHCSQAVFAAFAEQLGLNEREALKIGGCFGGGMNEGEVCGCVTGALMALGLKYGQADVEDMNSREKSRQLAMEFYDCFKLENGSCLCRELLGYDFGKPEDVELIRKHKPYLAKCPKLVESATKLVCDIMEKN